MSEIVGYAQIRESADDKLIVSVDPKSFKGKIVRVLEFERNGSSILAVNSDGSALAMIEGEAILRHFRCKTLNDVVTPPDLNTIEQFEYVAKCFARKGGYNDTCAKMVIGSSLHYGEFNDTFLWQKQ